MIAVFFPILSSPGQGEETLFQKGKRLVNEEHKYSEALGVFQELLKDDSTHIGHLNYASISYSQAGTDQPTEAKRKDYFKTALDLAKKAIDKDAESARAHYAYCIALGRLNEHADTRKKLRNARAIKKRAESAIELDPEMPGPYHVLGRWHRTFANFGTFERGLVDMIYGGMPEGGTYEEAVAYFKDAIRREPDNPWHFYEIARTYRDMDKTGYARSFAKKAVELSTHSQHMKEAQEKAGKLLEELD